MRNVLPNEIPKSSKAPTVDNGATKNKKMNVKIDKILNAIDYKMQIIDSFRPFSKEAIERVWQDEAVNYIYNSEAIEGNTITLNETYLILKDGVTIGGKPLHYLLDTVSHGNAFGYILQLVQTDFEISEKNIIDVLLKLHAIIKPSKCREFEIGNFRLCDVSIGGTVYTPPSAEEVESLMAYYLPKCLKYENPIVQAGIAHYYIAQIHPFSDGNGRAARLFSNFLLRKSGYPPYILKLEDRQNYYAALDANHSLDNPEYFLEYFAASCQDNMGRLFERLEKYLKART